jgi:hypothetical protein
MLRSKRLLGLLAFSSSLGALLALALAANAQNYSDWSAPVNLGATVNSAAFEG